MSERVKVKTLREHNNSYGEAIVKAEGAEYELPAAMAETLASAGLVEIVKGKPAAADKPGK